MVATMMFGGFLLKITQQRHPTKSYNKTIEFRTYFAHTIGNTKVLRGSAPIIGRLIAFF